MKKYTEFLIESKKSQVKDFLRFACDHLELEETPNVIIIDNPEFSAKNKTFGMYSLADDIIKVQIAERHPMDIYRTLAHELVHYKQKISGKEMDGGDGSEIENEANATAAVILRQYSHQIPNHGY
jgi:Zn-dependent peptidase ImmA (M78 family)